MRRVCLIVLALVLACPVVAGATPAKPDGKWYGVADSTRDSAPFIIVARSGYDVGADIVAKDQKQRSVSGWSPGFGQFAMSGDYFGHVDTNTATGAARKAGFSGSVVFQSPAPESLNTTSVAFYGRYFETMGANPRAGDPQYLTLDSRAVFTIPTAYGMTGSNLQAVRSPLPGSLGAYFVRPSGSVPLGCIRSSIPSATLLSLPEARVFVMADFIYLFERSDGTTSTWSVSRSVRMATGGNFRSDNTAWFTQVGGSVVSTVPPYPTTGVVPSLGSNGGAGVSDSMVLFPGSVPAGENPSFNTGSWPSGFDWTAQTAGEIVGLQASRVNTATLPLEVYSAVSGSWTPPDESSETSETSVTPVPGQFGIPSWAQSWGQSVADDVKGWLSPITDMFWPLDVLKGIQ